MDRSLIVSLATAARRVRPAVGEGLERVMRQDDDDAILIRRPDNRPVPGAERRVHLLEPPLQPVQLPSRYASFRATAGASGVEGDESHGRRVVHVVRRAGVEVLLRESMTWRLIAGLQVSVQEFAKDERAPVAVGCHVDIRTRHENFGPLDELLDYVVEVDSARKTEGFSRTDGRR